METSSVRFFGNLCLFNGSTIVGKLCLQSLCFFGSFFGDSQGNEIAGTNSNSWRQIIVLQSLIGWEWLTSTVGIALTIWSISFLLVYITSREDLRFQCLIVITFLVSSTILEYLTSNNIR